MTLSRKSGTVTLMSYNNRVAGNVRSAIATSGISLLQLARATGIARTTLTQQVNAEAKMSVDTLMRVANALEVDPAELLTSRPGRLPGRIGRRAAA